MQELRFVLGHRALGQDRIHQKVPHPVPERPPPMLTTGKASSLPVWIKV